jgi:hypothetical protein
MYAVLLLASAEESYYYSAPPFFIFWDDTIDIVKKIRWLLWMVVVVHLGQTFEFGNYTFSIIDPTPTTDTYSYKIQPNVTVAEIKPTASSIVTPIAPPVAVPTTSPRLNPDDTLNSEMKKDIMYLKEKLSQNLEATASIQKWIKMNDRQHNCSLPENSQLQHTNSQLRSEKAQLCKNIERLQKQLEQQKSSATKKPRDSSTTIKKEVLEAKNSELLTLTAKKNAQSEEHSKKQKELHKANVALAKDKDDILAQLEAVKNEFKNEMSIKLLEIAELEKVVKSQQDMIQVMKTAQISQTEPKICAAHDPEASKIQEPVTGSGDAQTNMPQQIFQAVDQREASGSQEALFHDQDTQTGTNLSPFLPRPTSDCLRNKGPSTEEQDAEFLLDPQLRSTNGTNLPQFVPSPSSDGLRNSEPSTEGQDEEFPLDPQLLSTNECTEFPEVLEYLNRSCDSQEDLYQYLNLDSPYIDYEGNPLPSLELSDTQNDIQQNLNLDTVYVGHEGNPLPSLELSDTQNDIQQNLNLDTVYVDHGGNPLPSIELSDTQNDIQQNFNLDSPFFDTDGNPISLLGVPDAQNGVHQNLNLDTVYVDHEGNPLPSLELSDTQNDIQQNFNLDSPFFDTEGNPIPLLGVPDIQNNTHQYLNIDTPLFDTKGNPIQLLGTSDFQNNWYTSGLPTPDPFDIVNNGDGEVDVWDGITKGKNFVQPNSLGRIIRTPKVKKRRTKNKIGF